MWLLFIVYSPIFSMTSSGDGTLAQHQETTVLTSVFRLVIFFFSTYQQYKVIRDKFAKGVGKAVLQVSGEGSCETL